MAKKKKVAKRSRAQKREEQKRSQRLRLLRISGLAILLTVVLAGFAYYRASTAPQVEAPLELMPDNIDGPIDAPVSIVEFGDFGCPACRAWHNSGIKDALKAEFGEQISFTFRHFPVITHQSPRAAEAGQCAAEQGQFWTFHDFIYEQTPLAELSPDQLRSYASAIGLEMEQFNACLHSGQFASYVSRDQQAAMVAGARGTPTFFINGRQVGFSFQDMASVIQDELNS
jgi:protein-disulfide isomerase